MKKAIRTFIFFSVAFIAMFFIKINDQNVYAANGQRLAKDINNDGVVDIYDISAIQNHILKTAELTGDNLAAADVNQDGEIDIFDIAAVQNLILFHSHEPGDWEVNDAGEYIRKCKICGEILDNNGPYTGWYTDRENNTYYYTEGKKSVGWTNINGELYNFDSNGIKSSTDSYTGWVTDQKGSSYYVAGGKKSVGWTNIDGRMYNFDSNGVKSSMLGIDVSKHQGDIDWQQVKNDGIEFAIIRIGYGDDESAQDDPKAVYNMNKCEELGIPYGVYLYSYALNSSELDSEVRHTLRMIEGRNPSIGVFLDMEDADGYKKNNGFVPEQHGDELTDFCVSFYQQITNRGYKAGIYANLNYYNSILNSSRFEDKYKWLAVWGRSEMPEGDWSIWQYTSDGSVNGISGPVDMDALIIKH